MFGVSDGQSTLAILLPDQQLLTLYRITRETAQEGTKLVCTPIRHLTGKAMSRAAGLSSTCSDLSVADSSNRLFLLTGAGHTLSLNARKTIIEQERSLKTGHLKLDRGQALPQVSTTLTCKSNLVKDVVSLLSSLLPAEAPHIITAFFQHCRESGATSAEQEIRSLQYALLGPDASRSSISATLSDWDWLTAEPDANETTTNAQRDPTPLSVAAQSLCLYAIHVVCEEKKLFVATQEDVRLLAPLIKAIAGRLHAWDYFEGACRDEAYLMARDLDTEERSDGRLSNLPLPFNVFANLLQRLKDSTRAQDPFLHLQTLSNAVYPGTDITRTISKHLQALQTVCHIFSSFPKASALNNTVSNQLEQLVLNCANAGMTYDDLNGLSAPVSIPLREAVKYCQSHIPVSWPKQAYALLDRADQMATTEGPAIGRRREVCLLSFIIHLIPSY